MAADGASGNGTEWPGGTVMSRLPGALGGELLRLGSPKPCPAGTVLLHQGEPSTHVFLLGHGKQPRLACVKVTAAARNGTESLLGIRVSGDLVGEMGVLRDGPRAATVTVCRAMTVHRIPLEHFRSFLRRREEAWRVVCHMIADRLDWANRRRLDFAGYDTAVRLARVLLELADYHGAPGEAGIRLGIQLSQPEFGKLIGAGRDAIQLAVRQLKEKNYIAYRYRTVTILDLNGLAAFADPG
ncbi:CRP/FNR family transcriptional regulator [Amycolatopsis mediterranei S699]|uniref:CRP/FNR family transcriptional regulator n=3 Tax=Amycolatopsis mediterranei TaxID=33910 RepID=A0A0H3CW05_AMYMU|nr:CRP/FNR family transcriptional regulator [Amycolatopsis mediterranei U32]AEK39169.1 CRP/FNR family transcriptional regulator [Amycolatopsis mediterranei S699]AGT81326.1 CRP/FNR family transcriptional regulator [Amycolatopsis mediterranei RB]KDO09609.1 Crp/Fnr family transcriptional regulator [Amycolatopsis mediterranei]AFO74197.1 CRP/FNR family transcriptional regulator [Amycolatopsis mediterranei S699]